MDLERIDVLLGIESLQECLARNDSSKVLSDRIYDFLLTDDYWISPEYNVVESLFKHMINTNLWDEKIALQFYRYLLFYGWEFECIILRTLLLEQNLKLAAEFCLETHLTDNNGISEFRADAIWRGFDYDDGTLPASHTKWEIDYDEATGRFIPI